MELQGSAISLFGIDAVLASVGTRLGPSRWVQLEQADVDEFGRLTGDSNWLHVDPAAAARGPFGHTIVHGYLTLCLTPMFLSELLTVTDAGTPVNYGCNRVRFPSPLKVGDKVRMVGSISSAVEAAGGVELVITVEFESEATPKPVCAAEVVIRYLSQSPG